MLPKSKIIVALDTNNFNKIKKLIPKISKQIYGVKVGYQFFFNFQSKGINFLRDHKLKIFFDFKLHDIPNTVLMAINAIKKYSPDMITVHISGGEKMLNIARKACNNSKLIGVTALTSLDNISVSKIYNRKTTLKLVKDLVKIALRNKLDGIVCSPQEIKMVKKISRKKLKIITPGIRNRYNKIKTDDQERTMNANKAIEHGADYLVIGRPVLNCKNPIKFIEDINEQTK